MIAASGGGSTGPAYLYLGGERPSAQVLLVVLRVFMGDSKVTLGAGAPAFIPSQTG